MAMFTVKILVEQEEYLSRWQASTIDHKQRRDKVTVEILYEAIRSCVRNVLESVISPLSCADTTRYERKKTSARY
jgi:hypothetical protein